MPFSGWEKECSKEQTSSLLIEEGHLQRDVVSTWEYRRYYVAQRGEKKRKRDMAEAKLWRHRTERLRQEEKT